MKKYKRAEFEKILRGNGYSFVRQTGGHYIWKKGGETIVITRDIQEPISHRLIKEHNLKIKGVKLV